MSAIFRRDKSTMPNARECILAFDAPSQQAFLGPAFETLVQTEAAKLGFVNGGIAGVETLPIDQDTDDIMTRVGPDVKSGGFRQFVRLQKMFA